ncbi:MAG: VOC family protein [Gemmiger sp.]|nr:VOC family protein [Gemmiger sp.]
MATMKNPLDLKGFIQIAILVEDIDKARHEWADILGVPVPEIIEQPKPAGSNPGLTYRGRETSYGLKLAVIQAPQGFIIELHQVTDDGDSTFKEFVQKHGYGVHHLGFQVGDRRDAVVRELEERGYPLRTVGIYPDGSWTIADTEDTLGVNLNIKPHM